VLTHAISVSTLESRRRRGNELGEFIELCEKDNLINDFVDNLILSQMHIVKMIDFIQITFS